MEDYHLGVNMVEYLILIKLFNINVNEIIFIIGIFQILFLSISILFFIDTLKLDKKTYILFFFLFFLFSISSNIYGISLSIFDMIRAFKKSLNM